MALRHPSRNVAGPPAILIILIALAYIEEDGLLLGVSIFGSFILLGSVTVPFW
jgi:hypothetical protein